MRMKRRMKNRKRRRKEKEERENKNEEEESKEAIKLEDYDVEPTGMDHDENNKERSPTPPTIFSCSRFGVPFPKGTPLYSDWVRFRFIMSKELGRSVATLWTIVKYTLIPEVYGPGLLINAKP